MQGQDFLPDTGIGSLKEQADTLARFGRYGDIYIVHAAEGETVIPMEVLDASPALKEMLFQQMREMGIEPERYVVGNELNSLNPITGQPEFFLKGLFKSVKKILKVAAPIIGAIAGSFIPGIGPILGPAIGGFLGAKLSGQDTMSALVTGGLAGLGGWGLSGTAAAAAGQAAGATTLGSQLWSGAVTQGGGIGSLLSAAGTGGGLASQAGSSVTAPLTSTSGQVANAFGSPGAAVITPAAGAAGGSTAAGGIGGGILSFLKANPGLAIAGGSALLSLLDKPEDAEPSKYWNGKTGSDLINENPGKYTFDAQQFANTGMAPAPMSSPVTNYSTPPAFSGGPSQPLVPYTQPYVQPYQPRYAREGGHISGPGTGTSDSIPAYLSDGEFVFTARAVMGAGRGSRHAGAKRMYNLMRRYEAMHNE